MRLFYDNPKYKYKHCLLAYCDGVPEGILTDLLIKERSLYLIA